MINAIINYFVKIWFNRIQNDAVEGYLANQEVNPQLVHEIRNKISNCQIKFKTPVIGRIIFPNNIDTQLAFHQFLLTKLIGKMFNSVLLSCMHLQRKIIYPLPLPWLRIIENSGLRVSYFWSISFFYLYIVYCWFLGVTNVFGHLKKNFKRKKINRKYAYFFNLNYKCFPTSSSKKSYDILSWYLKKYINIHKDSDSLIIHSVPNISDYGVGKHKVIYSPDSFSRISNFNFYFKFLPVVVFTILTLTLCLRFKYIILLKEIIDMYAYKYADDNNIGQRYFFSFANRLYRPLWTYIAESNGSSLIFYFYACNISNYKELNKSESRAPEFWHLMNWPKYLVWNEHHKKYIRALLKYPSDIEVVGPIGYEDNSFEVLKITKKSLIVFDIQPFILNYGIPTFCSPQWYTYDYKVRVNFYKDIHEICVELGIELFFKRKRRSNLADKNYSNFLETFVKNNNVHEVDSDISAF